MRRALTIACRNTLVTLNSFVVVPGVSKLRPENWHAPGRSTGSWLCSPELRIAGEITVLTYEHGLSPDSTLSWDQINDNGARLLDEIQQLQSNQLVSADYVWAETVLLRSS